MREISIAARVVCAMMKFAVSRGADEKELAERSGIDLHDLTAHEIRVPFSQYVALIRAAKALCNDPALMLHFGEEIGLSEISMIPFLGSSTSFVADDITQLNRFSPLDADFGGGERFELTRIGGELWLVDRRPDPNDCPEYTESFFARAVCEMRRAFGPPGFVKSVHVTHPQPSYRAEYDRIFQIPISFESRANALVLADERWPPGKPVIPQGHGSRVLREYAEELLGKLESAQSIRGRVEALLMPMLTGGSASMNAIASELGMSRQTLFRRLKKEGVTFERALDDLRRKMARDYLDERKVSVNETSYLLGFSDPAAFSRAFKRWTGTSPSAALAARKKNDRAAGASDDPHATGTAEK